MITYIPDNIKEQICTKVSDDFGVSIDESLINFIQEFQSKVAIDEGFAKLKTVRFFKFCIFRYNPKKDDSKNTMNRLMIKHDNDYDKAYSEFKTIGKIMNIEATNKKAEDRANKLPIIRIRDKVTAIGGMFTVK